jgi:hypothetical protein
MLFLPNREAKYFLPMNWTKRRNSETPKLPVGQITVGENQVVTNDLRLTHHRHSGTTRQPRTRNPQPRTMVIDSGPSP